MSNLYHVKVLGEVYGGLRGVYGSGGFEGGLWGGGLRVWSEG